MILLLNETISAFVNGKYIKEPNEELVVVNKFTQEEIACLTLASNNIIESAVLSAVEAFERGKMEDAGTRYNKLCRLQTLLLEEEDTFVKLIVQEAGKPLQYARAEFKRSCETLKLAIENCRSFTGEKIPINFDAGAGKYAFTERFATGPVLAFSPYNFPLNLVMHKIAPALAVGCSVVLKPSPHTPLTSLFLAELVGKSGFVDGTLNVVNCSNEQAEILVNDDRLKVFSFTGSASVGWFLKRQVGKAKVLLELGGNAAVYVDKSIENLTEIVQKIAYGSFLYSGQICISIQRIYVHENLFRQFADLFVEATTLLEIGDPKIETTVIGPLIGNGHLQKMQNWINDALSEGARVIYGGKIISKKNNLMQPAILTGTKKGMKVLDEEVFGPIVALESVNGIDEAIASINDSRYGLQTGIFTSQIDHAKKAFNSLETGAVLINQIPGFRMDHMPYGGIKDSGLGREGVVYTMREYTEERLFIF